MGDKIEEIDLAIHKKLAADYFNKTWEYLEKGDRTPEDDDAMVDCVHASRHHWRHLIAHGEGGPVNHARGDWIISRVYAILKKADLAIHYGKKSLQICQENNIGDFDLAYGYEALARAYAVAGKKIDAEKHFQQAKDAGDKIKEKESKEWFFKDLETIKL
jgi:tetratricopeptide (TPR) repeat protein